MASREVILSSQDDDETCFSLAPFLGGVFEAHMLASRDAEFALLVEEYLRSGGAAGIMAPEPAIHRTVPARGALKEEWVLPYEDVRQVILGAKSFRLQDCVCRVEQDKAGTRRCSFPLETCLLLSTNEVEGVGYICNCCGCCCELLRGINEWGIEHSVAQASYYAVIDLCACTDCGVCLERCQVNAIAQGDGGPIVDHDLCIGCGLCATGCQEKAAQLVRKPEAEIQPPPLDRRSWEEQRLRARADLSSPSS